MTEGNWKDWSGLPILPVPAEAIGDVRLRCGKVMVGVRARDVLWGRARREVAANDNSTNGGEIVAYNFGGEAA